MATPRWLSACGLDRDLHAPQSWPIFRLNVEEDVQLITLRSIRLNIKCYLILTAKETRGKVRKMGDCSAATDVIAQRYD